MCLSSWSFKKIKIKNLQNRNVLGEMWTKPFDHGGKVSLVRNMKDKKQLKERTKGRLLGKLWNQRQWKVFAAITEYVSVERWKEVQSLPLECLDFFLWVRIIRESRTLLWLEYFHFHTCSTTGMKWKIRYNEQSKI